jgi:hypothetical protein
MGGKVKLEIIGLMPTLFSHRRCHILARQCGLDLISSQLQEYPKSTRKLYFKVSELAWKVLEDFGGQVDVQVIDTASFKGLWKAVRYRIGQTPAFIVNGKQKFREIPTYPDLRRALIEAGGTPLKG